MFLYQAGHNAGSQRKPQPLPHRVWNSATSLALSVISYLGCLVLQCSINPLPQIIELDLIKLNDLGMVFRTVLVDRYEQGFRKVCHAHHHRDLTEVLRVALLDTMLHKLVEAGLVHRLDLQHAQDAVVHLDVAVHMTDDVTA